MRFELVHLLGESWFGLPAGVRLSLPSVAPAFEQPNWFMFINHAFCIPRSVWGLMLRAFYHSTAAE